MSRYLSTTERLRNSYKRLLKSSFATVILSATMMSPAWSQSERDEKLGGYQGSPYATWTSLYQAGYQVRTFRQNGLKNPQEVFVRRYLRYVPQVVYTHQKKHPVVIALHGSNLNAETFRDFDFGSNLEQLAEEEELVVIYANAHYMPGTNSDNHPGDPFWANTGYWRTCFGAPGVGPDFVVDDVEYVKRILQQLKEENLSIDEDRIYLMGISNGAEMVFRALREEGQLFAGAGVVNFIPVPPATEALASCEAELTQAPVSMMFIHSPVDTVLAPIFQQFGLNYGDMTRQNTASWMDAMGIDQSTVSVSSVPNRVFEGEGYAGDVPSALSTMNSQITRYDYDVGESGASVADLVIDHAGHAWPNFFSTPPEGAEAGGLGFKNEDIRAEVEIWNFLKDKRRIEE